jgi:putative FmdB family regulatory protein
MPTYHYKCTKCKHEFEHFQSMADEALTVCPECSGLTKRVISGGAGLLFRGDGFYITDYRSAGYKKDAKNDAKKEKPKSSDSSPAKKKSDS